MTAPLTLPGHQAIALAWLGTLGLTAQTGSELPADPTSWAEHGYVTAGPVIGGTPGKHVGMRNPVVQIDCWANSLGSEHAPWGKATDLTEQILAGCYLLTLTYQLTLPTGFAPILLRSVYPLTEPREIRGDNADFARLNFDLALHWTAT